MRELASTGVARAAVGERSGNKDSFRISDAQMRLITGVDMKKGDQESGSGSPRPAVTKKRVVKANKPRVMVLCLGPLLPALLLVINAFSYYRSIPAGDATTRYLAVGLCSVMAGALFGGAAFLYLTYTLKTFTLEPKRIIVVEGDSMVTASWTEVIAEPLRGGVVKTFVFTVAGRPKSIDSVFFPDFNAIVDDISERIRVANAALDSQTHVL